MQNPLPNKPIISLPVGYSEEEATNVIVNRVILMTADTKEEKDKILHSITAQSVYNLSLRFADALLQEFSNRYREDIEQLEGAWAIFQSTIAEGIYIGTLIFYCNKNLRKEEIIVPTGKQFEEYLNTEILKFDRFDEYADTLIPPYLFQAIKNISLTVFNLFSKEKNFPKTSKEFKEAVLVQYLHHVKSTFFRTGILRHVFDNISA